MALPTSHKAYIDFINQQKGAPLGQHRRPSPQAHSSPSHRAGGGAGAYGTSPAITLADYAKLFSLTYEPDPTPPPIPYAGIRTGEIIGERLWIIKRSGLCSLASDFHWAPGKTIVGDTNKIVQKFWNHAIMQTTNIYGGVYAFLPAHPQLVVDQDTMYDLNCYDADVLTHPSVPIGCARGRVKLWGDVVEHERGFRAQFAKLIHIDSFFSNPHDPRCKAWCETIVNEQNEAANAQATLPRT